MRARPTSTEQAFPFTIIDCYCTLSLNYFSSIIGLQPHLRTRPTAIFPLTILYLDPSSPRHAALPQIIMIRDWLIIFFSSRSLRKEKTWPDSPTVLTIIQSFPNFLLCQHHHSFPFLVQACSTSLMEFNLYSKVY